jgi:vacuolar-type H+-ATPase subunit I/STV1
VPLLMGPIRRTWADGKQQRIEDCIGDFMVGLTVAAAAIRKYRQETEERHRQWEEERRREEEERRIAEEQKRRAELVTELIEKWEEAARLRRFVKAIDEETARSGFSEVQKNDIQQVADWTREYADSLDPLCDLPEAIEEFVRPESKYWWME